MKTEDMNLADCDFVYGVLMDSSEQEKLINGENTEKQYALDYVYDSSLRELLDKRYEYLLLEKSLKVNAGEKYINKI